MTQREIDQVASIIRVTPIEPRAGETPMRHLDADDDDPAPTWPLILLGVVAFIASGIFFLASLPVLR